MLRASHACLLSALLGSALPACGGEPDSPAETETAGDEQASESETGESEPAPGDACEDTSLIVEAPTRIEASLRDASPDPIGLATDCGLTGPTIYIETTVDDRVDLFVGAVGREFTPRFAVLRPGCSADPSRVLACGEGLPVTITDIGPDVALLIAIGIDSQDPALALAADPPDPLEVELALEVRAVLAELAPCGPAYGRCEPGTVCLPELEDGVAVDRCRRPPADSCVNPGTTVVPSPGAAVVFEIPPDEPHSDAHEHACTGWRRPERVERLELPAGLGESATLTITTDDPRVGLALRGADCAPEHALGCAPATGIGEATSLSVAAAELGAGPLLFIELPDIESSVEVSVEILE